MNEIIFSTEHIPDVNEITKVYEGSGINRPTADKARMAAMFAHSNLVATAYDGGKLVGVARSLTDFSYCCYMSDLAVLREYQHRGIGKKLIEITKERIGDESNLLLLAAPDAADYYPKVGFQKVENGFIIKRKY